MNLNEVIPNPIIFRDSAVAETSHAWVVSDWKSSLCEVTNVIIGCCVDDVEIRRADKVEVLFDLFNRCESHYVVETFHRSFVFNVSVPTH